MFVYACVLCMLKTNFYISESQAQVYPELYVRIMFNHYASITHYNWTCNLRVCYFSLLIFLWYQLHLFCKLYFSQLTFSERKQCELRYIVRAYIQARSIIIRDTETARKTVSYHGPESFSTVQCTLKPHLYGCGLLELIIRDRRRAERLWI